jgi:hypothetical protein
MAEAEAEGEIEEDEVGGSKVEEEETEELEVEECKVEEEVIEVLKVEELEVEECRVEEEEIEELKVDEEEVEDFKLEELEVELVDNTDVVEELELLLDALTVLLKSYKSSLFAPPQYSDWLPLQGILHPVKPSGAGPPPLEKTLPQSIKHV